jgi:hypothetical protein
MVWHVDMEYGTQANEYVESFDNRESWLPILLEDLGGTFVIIPLSIRSKILEG